MDFFDCMDIFDFYAKTGLNRQEAFLYLISELNKIKDGSETNEKQQQY